IHDGYNEAQRSAFESVPGSRSRYWRVRALVAEADHHAADALAYWRLAVQQADLRTMSPTIARDRTALDRLWRSLGGSDDALALWMAPGAPTSRAAVATTAAAPAVATADPHSDWDSASDSLPPFSLTDLSGRTWTLAQLSGKTVFVNVWATWCGPCQAEIPHVRDLNDRLSGRDDVVLLSFNTDDSAGVVAPFARAHKMTWPVLFAAAYFDGLGGSSSVPQNWVIDSTGIRRNIQMGFDPRHADLWLESALAVIDKASTASPTRTAAPPPPSDSTHP
ncbi:MAG TPA: TlpA disulfide reductase family protein, partial [Candidatus Polarisedimenticolia bacterium]|nr:TlpA disulfide reductase family protein [Candidatus Polarisedimenticolia bacterium]